MLVNELMTKTPVCCTPDTDLQEIAQVMQSCDFGMIVVVDTDQNMVPVGVVTDRDIVCRVLARGTDIKNITAKNCMSSPCITMRKNDQLDDTLQIMKEKQIRRIVSVDENGKCCGVLSLSDVARTLVYNKTGEVMHFISQRTPNYAYT